MLDFGIMHLCLAQTAEHWQPLCGALVYFGPAVYYLSLHFSNAVKLFVFIASKNEYVVPLRLNDESMQYWLIIADSNMNGIP